MAGIYDIVGYDYRGDHLCAGCIKGAMPTGEGQELDGWADATGTMSAEEFLQGIADAFGVDRLKERTYTTFDFPKVLFRGAVLGGECDSCGKPLA